MKSSFNNFFSFLIEDIRSNNSQYILGLEEELNAHDDFFAEYLPCTKFSDKERDAVMLYMRIMALLNYFEGDAWIDEFESLQAKLK